MFRKKEFKNLTSRYDQHLYSGIQGYLMNLCHNQLEDFNFSDNISQVLEIGAGNKTHHKFIKHKYDEYHIAETSTEDIEIDDNPKVLLKKYKSVKQIRTLSVDELKGVIGNSKANKVFNGLHNIGI